MCSWAQQLLLVVVLLVLSPAAAQDIEFVAVGEGGNTLATSVDGTTGSWIGRGAVFSSKGRNAYFHEPSQLWVATGEGTRTISTPDNCGGLKPTRLSDRALAARKE